jgi:hypothetical protein
VHFSSCSRLGDLGHSDQALDEQSHEQNVKSSSSEHVDCFERNSAEWRADNGKNRY